MAAPKSKTRERIRKNNHRNNGTAAYGGHASGQVAEPSLLQTKRKLWIQTQLMVGASNDKYEQEADAMARHVVSGSAQPVRIQPKCKTCGTDLQTKSLVQRNCPQCEAKESEAISRKQAAAGSASGGPASSGLENRIGAMRNSGGRPLDNNQRNFFESRMGYDFSDVRLHVGPDAQETAKDLNAKAYTVGKDIAFGKGQYQPETNAGKELLAHELTHTVQQGAARRKEIQAKEIQPKENTGEQPAKVESEKPAGEKPGRRRRGEISVSLPSERKAAAKSEGVQRRSGRRRKNTEVIVPSQRKTEGGRDVAQSPPPAIVRRKPRAEIQRKVQDYIEYTTKYGDTLWSLSRKFGIPVRDIVALNESEHRSIGKGKKEDNLGHPWKLRFPLKFSRGLVWKLYRLSNKPGLRDAALKSKSTGPAFAALVKHVQEKIGVPETGLLDDETIKDGEEYLAAMDYNQKRWGAWKMDYVKILSDFVPPEQKGFVEMAKYPENQYHGPAFVDLVKITQRTLKKRGVRGIEIDGKLTDRTFQAGVKHRIALRKEAIGRFTAGDWGVFSGYFAEGIFNGAYECIKDLIVGLKDLAEAIWEILKSLFTGNIIEDTKKLWQDIKNAPWDAMVFDLKLAFFNPDPKGLGRFWGKVVGYAVMEIVLAFFSGGIITAVKAASRTAKGAKFVKALSTVVEGAAKLRKKVPPKARQRIQEASRKVKRGLIMAKRVIKVKVGRAWQRVTVAVSRILPGGHAIHLTAGGRLVSCSVCTFIRENFADILDSDLLKKLDDLETRATRAHRSAKGPDDARAALRLQEVLDETADLTRLLERRRKNALDPGRKSIAEVFTTAKRLKIHEIKKLMKLLDKEVVVYTAFQKRFQRSRAVEKLMAHIDRGDAAYKGLKANSDTARLVINNILNKVDDVYVSPDLNRIKVFSGPRGISIRMDNYHFDTFLDKGKGVSF